MAKHHVLLPYLGPQISHREKEKKWMAIMFCRGQKSATMIFGICGAARKPKTFS